jgi:hypothetical protein
MCDLATTLRCDANASQIIKINRRSAVNDSIAPNDDTTFHFIRASGKSEYRRGIPLNPKKCCGKNVKFTPRNIM